MKKVILYIRVSTDEQADKGYSQRDQHERLHRYCQQNSIEVLRTIYEDHSAKTFNRLEWSRMLADLKRVKGRPDQILFTKWDRFSRDDRRSLNVFYGMRRAKKEGRFMGTAPLGYINRSSPEGKKYIAPYEPEAGIMKWVFQEIARNVFAVDQIRKKANTLGLKMYANDLLAKR